MNDDTSNDDFDGYDFMSFDDDRLNKLVNEQDSAELIRHGFNRVVDNSMMFYMMVQGHEADTTYVSPGLWTRFKDVFRRQPRVRYGHGRIYAFVVKAASILDVSKQRVVEFLLKIGAVEMKEQDELPSVSESVIQRWSGESEETRQAFNEEIGADADVEVVTEIEATDEDAIERDMESSTNGGV